MTMREDYEKRLQAQLADWKVELDKLWAKSKDAKADAAKEYHRQIDKLKAQRETMEKDLAKMRKAGEDFLEGPARRQRAGLEVDGGSGQRRLGALPLGRPDRPTPLTLSLSPASGARGPLARSQRGLLRGLALGRGELLRPEHRGEELQGLHLAEHAPLLAQGSAAWQADRARG